MSKSSRNKKLATSNPASALPLISRNPKAHFCETVGGKLSGVLLCFGDGYLPSSEDEHAYRERFAECVLAWNLSLLPDNERQSMLIRATSSCPQGVRRAELNANLCLLISKKHALFGEDRRYIDDYELSFTDSEVSISVASFKVKRSPN
jgi:hypothetical protein